MTVLLVVAIVALLAVAAVLAVAETVLVRLDLVRALALDEDEAPGATDLVWLLERRGTALNVTLLLTITVRVTTAVLAVVLMTRRLATGTGAALAIVTVVVVSMLLAEVGPRSRALRHLDVSGRRIAPTLRLVVRAVDPLSRVLVAVGRALAGVRPESGGPYPPEDDHADASDQDDDELEEDERAMIRSIFELGDTIVREIMVPRPDMVTVADEASLRELVNVAIEHGYSRLPVHHGDRDHIIGVVYVKDVLRRLALQPDRGGWLDLVRTAEFVPETKLIDDLLRELQARSVHIVMVVDEYGAVTGLATIEDILEEIVGEIVDEHDQEEPLVEVIDEGRLRIDARLPVDDLNELLDVELPDEDWDTVGGLVVGALGHVPDPGEMVELDGVAFTAERVQGRRVAKVLVERRREGSS